MRPDTFNGLHTAHLPLQNDIHQDQVGMGHAGFFDRIFPGKRHGRYGIAKPLQHGLHVLGNDAFILNNHDLRARHAHPFSLYVCHVRR